MSNEASKKIGLVRKHGMYSTSFFYRSSHTASSPCKECIESPWVEKS
jgi:hypothetical protein